MARAERYDDLIFQLGDLARERLARRAGAPRAMERVLRAEEALLTRREELAELETRMNEEDAHFRRSVRQVEHERERLAEVARRWRRVVDGIQGKVKELRKKLSGRKADLRYGHTNLKKEEAKHHDLELSGAGSERIELSRQNLKRMRLVQMRLHREIEELEQAIAQMFDVREGQPGAEGILAHKRMLELEDEQQAEQDRFDGDMAEFERQLAEKDEEIKAAEAFLDQSLYLLGEECYAQRIADPMLAALYPRIDKAS